MFNYNYRRTKLIKWSVIALSTILGFFLIKLVIGITFFVSIISVIPSIQNYGSNILVVGLDDGAGPKRADAISIIHFNSSESKVRALSIPRDTRVKVEGIGVTKINHAFAHGGVELLKSTISDFLSIPIHNFIIVNSKGVNQIVDTIGGIEIDIKEDMTYHDYAANLHIEFKKGRQLLDGESLSQYIRFRNNSKGDIGRIERQQQVISTLFEKIFRVRSLVVTPKLISIFSKSVDTDLSFLKMNNYLKLILTNRNALDMQFLTVPGSVRLIDRVSYWRPNIVALDKIIDDTFVDFSINEEAMTKDKLSNGEKRYITSKEIERVGEQLSIDEIQKNEAVDGLKVEVLNGNGYLGVATNTANFLRRKKIAVKKIGNSKSFDYGDTIIVDWKGNLENSLFLASLLNVDASNIVVYDRQEKPIDITLVLGKDWTSEYLEGLSYARSN